jgi:hypothetical protein
VPVYASNQATGPYQSEPLQARAEVRRIYGDFQSRKLGAGTVHLYILKPDASSLTGLGPGEAADPVTLERLLTSVIRQLGTVPGAPLVKPRPQSVPPLPQPEELVTHLVSRAFGHGAWHEFPSENWIIFSHQEWLQLLPSQAPHPGDTWQLGPALIRKLLTRFYPQTEEVSNADRNRIDEATLRLTITTIAPDVARARFDGKLRMEHSFYPGKDRGEEDVDATLTGFFDFNPAERHIQRLRLVTDRAIYMNTEFGAALTSVSAETLEALLARVEMAINYGYT